MKKLLIVLFTLAIGLGASAQKYAYRGHGGGFYARPRVSIGIGAYASPFYGYYGSPYGNSFYSPFYQPAYRSARPSKLDLQIEDINHDYDQKIWGVKNDDNLSRKEKRKEVHELKAERDQEILDAKKNYYKY